MPFPLPVQAVSHGASRKVSVQSSASSGGFKCWDVRVEAQLGQSRVPYLAFRGFGRDCASGHWYLQGVSARVSEGTVSTGSRRRGLGPRRNG